jgi:hypothetical protein
LADGCRAFRLGVDRLIRVSGIWCDSLSIAQRGQPGCHLQTSVAARHGNHLHPGCSPDPRNHCRSDAGGAQNLRLLRESAAGSRVRRDLRGTPQKCGSCAAATVRLRPTPAFAANAHVARGVHFSVARSERRLTK